MLLSFALRRAAVRTHTHTRARGCKCCELRTDEECEEPGGKKKKELGHPSAAARLFFLSVSSPL